MARNRDEPVRLTKIYTRGGDRGETSLGDGSRASKLDPRIGAYGSVDELNSLLGVALAGQLPDAIRAVLERVQNELFDVGADLSVPWEGEDDKLRTTQEQVDALEADCDFFNADLPELKSFVLPGGDEGAARIHVARAVCRRAERDALAAPVNPLAVVYLNRLSDLLFILARAANAAAGRDEPLWEAGQLALTFAASFAAGYLGSAVGLVLGTLRLPAILLAAGNPAAAAGTNIAISAAAAATGGWRHAREGRVDWKVVAWMTPPSVVGAVIGALAGSSVPERGLFAAIAAMLAWNGIDLLVRPIRARPRAEPRLWPAGIFGFAIGLVGGAIGVILGTLRMPALLGAVGLTAHKAVGTNLVVGFALGVAGFAAHAAKLEVEWDLLAVGLAGALPGAWLGARATGRFSEETLRRLIGAALLLIALLFAVQAALG